MTQAAETIRLGDRSYLVRSRIHDGGRSVIVLCSAVRQGGGVSAHVDTVLKQSVASEVTHLVAEAALMRRLNHPNIVRCFDVDVAPLGDGTSRVTLVLEYCKGMSIARRMQELSRSGKLLEPFTIVNIFSSVVSAVLYLHSRSPPIAHRDVKPENILECVTPEGQTVYKLCDFGSATTYAYEHAKCRNAARISAELEQRTTAAYRSPEMVDPWSGERIDELSDVWALGVTLYYLMHHKLPFEESTLGVLNGTLRFPSPHPSEGWAEHRPLRAIVTACLARRHARPTAADVAATLRRAFPGTVGAKGGGDAKNSQPPTQPLVAWVGAEAKDAAPVKTLFDMLDWSPSTGVMQAPAQLGQVNAVSLVEGSVSEVDLFATRPGDSVIATPNFLSFRHGPSQSTSVGDASELLRMPSIGRRD